MTSNRHTRTRLWSAMVAFAALVGAVISMCWFMASPKRGPTARAIRTTQAVLPPLLDSREEADEGGRIDLIGRIQTNPNDTFAMSRLAVSGDAKALAVLRVAYQHADQKLAKQVAASWLLRIGDRDQEVFDFLARYAAQAAESDAPFPGTFGSNGEIIRGKLNPAFIAWCGKRGLDPESAAQSVALEQAGDMKHLARAEDPRAVPIFCRGLKSPNYLVVVASAQGLALLGEASAVKDIVEAMDRVPEGMRRALALTLLVFDDPVARAAVEQQITDHSELAQLRAVVAEKGARALF